MRYSLLFSLLFLTGCFLMELAEEQPPRYRQDDASLPEMSMLYRTGYKIYVGRLKSRSPQTTGFPDGPTFNKIRRVVVEDPYNCVAGLKAGEFVLRDSCEASHRMPLENVEDLREVPSNRLKLIGGYELKSRRPLTPIHFICFMIVETEEQVQAISLSFELTPELRMDATGETVPLGTAIPYLHSLYCPHDPYAITWKPKF